MVPGCCYDIHDSSSVYGFHGLHLSVLFLGTLNNTEQVYQEITFFVWPDGIPGRFRAGLCTERLIVLKEVFVPVLERRFLLTTPDVAQCDVPIDFWCLHDPKSNHIDDMGVDFRILQETTEAAVVDALSSTLICIKLFTRILPFLDFHWINSGSVFNDFSQYCITACWLPYRTGFLRKMVSGSAVSAKLCRLS